MAVLATWAPEDGVLGAIAPLALAIAKPTRAAALVVDLDPDGPAFPGQRTLRDLVVDGLRSDELTPGRRGVAVVANGGVALGDSVEIVDLLCRRWHAVVLRMCREACDEVSAPIVPVHLLTPGPLFAPHGRAVYQPTSGVGRVVLPEGSKLLPRVARRTVATLLAGRRPVPGRWLAAWREVWEMVW